MSVRVRAIDARSADCRAEAVTLGRRAEIAIGGGAFAVSVRRRRVLALRNGATYRRPWRRTAERMSASTPRGSEKRARTERFATAASGWYRGDQNNSPRKCGHGARGTRRTILTAWPHAAGRRRRPWRAQALAAAGLRPLSRATQHSSISLGTHRETLSHHFDDTAHRPLRFNTRINTPRTVFCYIGWLFFEKSIYIFPDLDTDESMSSAGYVREVCKLF